MNIATKDIENLANSFESSAERLISSSKRVGGIGRLKLVKELDELLSIATRLRERIAGIGAEVDRDVSESIRAVRDASLKVRDQFLTKRD